MGHQWIADRCPQGSRAPWSCLSVAAHRLRTRIAARRPIEARRRTPASLKTRHPIRRHRRATHNPTQLRSTRRPRLMLARRLSQSCGMAALRRRTWHPDRRVRRSAVLAWSVAIRTAVRLRRPRWRACGTLIVPQAETDVATSGPYHPRRRVKPAASSFSCAAARAPMTRASATRIVPPTYRAGVGPRRPPTRRTYALSAATAQSIPTAAREASARPTHHSRRRGNCSTSVIRPTTLALTTATVRTADVNTTPRAHVGSASQRLPS
jgi:hypothetical protein